jgi:hypothetical protein
MLSVVCCKHTVTVSVQCHHQWRISLCYCFQLLLVTTGDRRQQLISCIGLAVTTHTQNTHTRTRISRVCNDHVTTDNINGTSSLPGYPSASLAIESRYKRVQSCSSTYTLHRTDTMRGTISNDKTHNTLIDQLVELLQDRRCASVE